MHFRDAGRFENEAILSRQSMDEFLSRRPGEKGDYDVLVAAHAPINMIGNCDKSTVKKGLSFSVFARPSCACGMLS
jgi:hypothetical protein